MIAGLIHFIWKVIWNTTVILVCAGLFFIGFKTNQPMSVPDAPEGMTYFNFMQDRIDAAKTIEPSRCGWGMMLSLAAVISKISEGDKKVIFVFLFSTSVKSIIAKWEN